MPLGGISGPVRPLPPDLSKPILAAIKASHVIAKARNDASRDDVRAEMVEDALKQIALIPERVAQAILDKQDNARLFKLLPYTKGYASEWPRYPTLRSWAWGYFLFPSWMDWKFARKPQPVWLDEMGSLVWDYCYENGLRPYFEPWTYQRGGKRSAICVRFDLDNIERLLAKLPNPKKK